jgi:hypothetical protein
MKHVVAGLGLFVLVAGPASRAAADTDLVNPRALGMGESLRAAATGALATVLNPAGVALAKTYVLEGGYAYRPEDSANIQFVAICDSVTTSVAACLAYDHLSADMTTDGQGARSRHQAGLTLGVPLGESLALGTTLRYVSYTESPPPSLSAYPHDGLTLDAGLTYRLMPTLTLGVAGYNLAGNDDGHYTRALGFGLAWSAQGSLLVAADGRYDFGAKSGRYGGGAEYLFTTSDGQSGFPLRLGFVYDSGLKASYLTGGLGVVTPRIAVDLAARKEVDGPGNELMLQASLRVFFPTQ